MKHKRLCSLLLTLALLATFCFPAMAGDNWWEEYVSSPSADWSIATENGTVTSAGDYLLFTSDCHRYTYLIKDLLAAANDVIEEDGETGNVGLIAFGGDFANEKVLYDDNMSILQAAIASSEGTVAVYTKGNHEGNVSDEDFEALTGMSRVGETAINADGDYYFYNFGAYNGTDQFLEKDIEALDEYLSNHTDKPVFMVSHYPIHYYSDRRSATNADKLVEVLNKYPNAVFLWGHNHTEQDPNYGMVRLPGDIIQTGADASTSVEINFTYACLGALRDGVNGSSGLLAKVDGNTVTFRYIDLHNSTTDDTWTDAQGNENSVRVIGTPTITSETVVDTTADNTIITLANLQIDRPLVDNTPAETANVYSPRFTAGEISWTADGTPVAGTFDFDTTYTATLTLTAQEGYTFSQDAVVSVNKEYVGPMPGQKNNEAQVTVSQDGKTAQVSYTFDATVKAGTEPIAAATELVEGGTYVLAAADSNIAASYLYNPADHGDESMPDYTAAAADVVIRDGKLVSEVTASTTFTAQKDDSGYLLYSDASLLDGQGATTLNFLSMSTRGGEMGLQASEEAGLAIYNDWNIEDGVPYLNVDGAKRYAAYVDGAFTFVSDPAESNVRLYQVGTSDSKIIYNVNAVVPTPAAGAAASALEDITTDYPTFTVENISWDAETFDYDTAYTVTLTLAPKAGYTISDILTGRVNGNEATVAEENGTITLTYTFAATPAAAGSVSGLRAKETDTITSGKQYIVVADGTALTTGVTDGLYLVGQSVTTAAGEITSSITTDMIFTLSGNEEDGYTLQNGDNYLTGLSDGSPDTWGFTTTTAASSAVSFAYTDGKLEKVVDTNSMDANTTSYLYLSDGHFNFGNLQSSDFTLYELYLPFTDVSGWSTDEIYTAAANGLMLGTSDTTFAPTGTMTRAMAITVLYRMAGSPAVTGTCSFTDVKQDYYTDAVIWGTQNNIVEGYSSVSFKPDAPVTREEFATFIARYLTAQGIELTDGDAAEFTDAASIQSYAKDAVMTCAKAGILQGYEDGTVRPARSTSREEAAAILVRLMNAMK